MAEISDRALVSAFLLNGWQVSQPATKRSSWWTNSFTSEEIQVPHDTEHPGYPQAMEKALNKLRAIAEEGAMAQKVLDHLKEHGGQTPAAQ